MNEQDPKLPKTGTKLSLAELLAKSMEDDGLPADEDVRGRERLDEDEGSFGG